MAKQIAAVIVTLLALGAGELNAQVTGMGRVIGSVYDSIAGRPFAGAHIIIAGSSVATTTDSLGRFRFDSVAPGSVTLVADHPALDAIGIYTITSRAAVRPETVTEVALGSPSFPTLWKAACGIAIAPASQDSGLVYGVVRDGQTKHLVSGANVDATWLGVSWQPGKAIDEQQFQGRTISNATGSYAICGVPVDMSISIRATATGRETGFLDIGGEGYRVVRRDLVLGPALSDSTRVAMDPATLRGTVLDERGPRSGARLRIDGITGEVVSGIDGRFIWPLLPPGSRQAVVTAIGSAPVRVALDLNANDTTEIYPQLLRLTTLGTVRIVSARGNRIRTDLEERREKGWGRFLDSTRISRANSVPSAISRIPFVQVEHTARSNETSVYLPGRLGGRCRANVVVDGFTSDMQYLNSLRPHEIAAIEVYERPNDAPLRYAPPSGACGVIIVWTKLELQ